MRLAIRSVFAFITACRFSSSRASFASFAAA